MTIDRLSENYLRLSLRGESPSCILGTKRTVIKVPFPPKTGEKTYRSVAAPDGGIRTTKVVL